MTRHFKFLKSTCDIALGVKIGYRLMRPLPNHKDVGSNPAAARNENTDFGQTPAQKVPQIVWQDLSGRPAM